MPVGAQVGVRVRVGDGVTQRGHSPPCSNTTVKVGHVGAGQGVSVISAVGVGVSAAGDDVGVRVAQNGQAPGVSTRTPKVAQPVGVPHDGCVGVNDGTGVVVNEGVGVAHTDPHPPGHPSGALPHTITSPAAHGGGVHTGPGDCVGCGDGVGSSGQPFSA